MRIAESTVAAPFSLWNTAGQLKHVAHRTQMPAERRIPKITKKQIDDFIANLPAGLAAEVRMTTVVDNVLVDFLGREWVERHVYGDHRGPDPYLRALSTGPAERFRHHDRVTRLADLLFNLQDVAGIETRINALLRDTIEPTMFELEAAAFLRWCGVEVFFRGSGYEMDLLLGTDEMGCEVKCKIENTPPSEATIRNAINTARDQLPRDRGNIVFLKLPEGWVSAFTGVASGVEKALKQTRRINAVVLIWEKWIPSDTGSTRRMEFRPLVVTTARHPISALSRLQSPKIPADWLWLSEYLGITQVRVP